jgi:tetratricopeptide (TPR) repeat protein
VVLIVGIASCNVAPSTPALSGLSPLLEKADSGIALPRPHLPTGADTNSAAAYYNWGVPLVRFGIKLDTAEMALYWASRLDPSWPDPIYGRAVVILQALKHDAFETWLRSHSIRAVRHLDLSTRQLELIDSLQRIAWARNPFLYTDLEFAQLAPGRPGDPARAGWLAFASRRFGVADSLFALDLHKHPEDVGVRIYRARALFYLERYDSAVAELVAARDSIRGRVAAAVARVLPSVEMFDYAIGIARVQQDDFPAARAAFERALTENLSFYWAHARLAGSALALADTTTALTELAEAVEIEGRDPLLRMYNGAILRDTRRFDEAVAQLQEAIALDPYYAAPHYWLATVYQAQGKVQQAIAEYSWFLDHAARADPYRPTVLRALNALGAARSDSSR